MRKEEITKLYEHIFIRLGSRASIITVGFEAQELLNGVSMLHYSGIMSNRDFTNMTGYIIGIAEDRIKTLNYERLQKDDK